VYREKFEKWLMFAALRGQTDVFLADKSGSEMAKYICAFAAWALSKGVWSGETIIQALSAIRHTFRSEFQDFTVFSSESIAALRRALRLTDWWNEARRNRKKRLPYTMDMMDTSSRKAVGSSDPHTVMVGTAINMAATVLLRASEYSRTTAPGNTLAPDHMIRSKNVSFFVEGSQAPLTPNQLRLRSSQQHTVVTSVSLTIAGSKTDPGRDGTMFSFLTKDMDRDDPTNSIAMWTRWACFTEHLDDDPFFSYRTSRSVIVELSPNDITKEIRLVAREHGIPERELYRFTPHSIRIGMATHLHNMGMTPLMILQMGRWSINSSAAPRYQRLGQGVCSMAATTMSKANKREGQTSDDILRTLVRPEGANLQYTRPGQGLRAENPRKRPRGDLLVPVTDVSLQSQFCVSGPRGVGATPATREVSVANATASSVSSQQERTSRRPHADAEVQATGVTSDSGRPRSSFSEDQRWNVQQSAGKCLILRTSAASGKSRSGLCLRKRS
jgi:hypothetical protein